MTDKLASTECAVKNFFWTLYGVHTSLGGDSTAGKHAAEKPARAANSEWAWVPGIHSTSPRGKRGSAEGGVKPPHSEAVSPAQAVGLKLLHFWLVDCPLPWSLCDNLVQVVIPIPQPRERSESWTPMVRSESDLKSENLALSILKAVRDSSSSASKEWRTPRNDTQTGLSHILPWGKSGLSIRNVETPVPLGAGIRASRGSTSFPLSRK